MSIFDSEFSLFDPISGGNVRARFDRHAAAHIVLGHVQRRAEIGCWDAWMSMLCKALRQSTDVWGLRLELLELLANAVKDEAEIGLKRPMVMVYDVANENVQTRVVVFLNGAIAALRKRGTKPIRFSTCFFPTAAVLCNRPAERYRRVAMEYLETYAERMADGTIRLPSPPHSKWVEQERELRTRIRFRSAENWGFDAELSEDLHTGRIP